MERPAWVLNCEGSLKFSFVIDLLWCDYRFNCLMGRRVLVFYLPPCSPDLKLIEIIFLKLKAHLRKVGARTFDQMFDALAYMCQFFTPGECWNFFCQARYESR